MSVHEQIMAGVAVTITIPAYCTNAELWEILMAAYDKELDRILADNPTPITDPARLLGPGVDLDDTLIDDMNKVDAILDSEPETVE